MTSRSGLLAVRIIALAGATAGIAPAEAQLAPFTEEAVQRGVIYEVRPYGTGQANGFGVAIADLNGNGHQDLVMLGDEDGLVGIFENDGTGNFIDRSLKDGGGGPVAQYLLPRPSGIAVADYNGDGMLDIYVTQEMNQGTGQTYPNLLLRNDGDFMFTNVAADAGVAQLGHSQGAAWGDYDNDGWLDLYVCNYAFPSQMANPQFRNKLFRNRGDGTFTDVSAALGVDNEGQTFTAVFTDINRNGWLDLYIANDRGHFAGFPTNQLWKNNGGIYENICTTSNACIGLYAMCVAAGDFTGNGFPDFYVTNIAHPSAYNGWNPLITNQGDETFLEQCTEAGVCQLITSWAGIFFDFDNNAWLDLYVCNQSTGNNLFSNSGTFPVSNITHLVNIAGSTGWSYNAAVGDVTGNGSLDLLLNNYGIQGGSPANVQLFINHEGEKRNHARFNIVGYAPNHHAIGANIEVTAGGQTQWREIYAGGNNFKAQNELVFHFGLGSAGMMDQIVVNWPGGQTTRTLNNYPANHTWTIYPPEVLGDANGDSVINVVDLLALLGAWGQIAPGSEIMDINGDGIINVVDLLGLLGKWGDL